MKQLRLVIVDSILESTNCARTGKYLKPIEIVAHAPWHQMKTYEVSLLEQTSLSRNRAKSTNEKPPLSLPLCTIMNVPLSSSAKDPVNRSTVYERSRGRTQLPASCTRAKRSEAATLDINTL